MTLNIRRVVTGHDAQGRSTILVDEQVSNQHSPRPGAIFSVIWSSEGFPVDNDGSEDPSTKNVPTALDNAFMVIGGPQVALT